MGRSDSRLSKTRSAVVSGSLLLRFATPRLPFPAPVPPYRLRRREQRIARLRHRCLKYIKAADVVLLSRKLTQTFVHMVGILSCQSGKIGDSQQLKVAKHCWPDGNQVLQFARR